MAISLVPLPQNAATSGSALVAAINDRLRRISLSLGGGAPGAPGAAGAPGTPGAAAGTGYYTIAPVGGVAQIDLANGPRQRLVLSASAVRIPSPVWAAVVIKEGMNFILYVDEDATGGRDAPEFLTALTSPPGAFMKDVPLVQIDPTPSTRTTYVFSAHAGPVWGLDSTPRTGGAIS